MCERGNRVMDICGIRESASPLIRDFGFEQKKIVGSVNSEWACRVRLKFNRSSNVDFEHRTKNNIKEL